MNVTFTSGPVYMVIHNDDLTATTVPPLDIEFGPKRRTLKWRGKRFNVPTVRVVRIGAAIA